MPYQCQQCQAAFDVPEDDMVFYDKVSPVFPSASLGAGAGKKCPVPPPQLCPDCRLQRRIAWRNERFLYPRKCDLCQKNIVSIYAPGTPFPIYCIQCWWSDKWDPKDYGKEFDFNRPFFDQWAELRDRVPQIAIMNDNGVASENCEYCQDYAFGKNCYFMTGSWYSEDSFYSSAGSDHSKKICDCVAVANSELVYEATDCRKLYHCAFIQDSENCSDCFFGFDLKDCRNCLFSYNLRGKEYHIFNKPHSKDEYEKKRDEIFNGSYSTLQGALGIWRDHVRKNAIFRCVDTVGCENCEGNHLFYSRDTVGFNIEKGDHAKYFHRGDSPSWSYDIFNSGRCQYCLEGNVPDDSYMSLFTLWCWKDKNVLYGYNCHSSEHLFGCISMKRGKYAILNKQVTQEEYEALVPKIIEHMTRTGEWGEYFPVRLASYGYNETVAQEYFPLTQEQAGQKGWKWREPEKKEYSPASHQLADNIKDTSDSVTDEVLACVHCRKNYRIVSQELAFYRTLKLPVPRKCPACRHLERQALQTPYRLFDRACGWCMKPIKSGYAEGPNSPEKVYCEECYLKKVY